MTIIEELVLVGLIICDVMKTKTELSALFIFFNELNDLRKIITRVGFH